MRQTGGVASKYDVYWAGQLEQLRAGLRRAAAGAPVAIEVPGLRRLGARRSWYGVTEVRGREVIRSSMAHASSLGKIVAADGSCAQWPDHTFRLAIDNGGEMLTVTAFGDPRAADPQPPATALGATAPKAVISEPSLQGPAERAPCRHTRSQGGTGNRKADADEFYRLLAELERREGGRRWLRDARGKHGWPRQGVYFFFEDGEIRAEGSDRVVRVGTHALTATSRTTLWHRLRQHRGHLAGRHPGGGDRHTSIFRWHVGSALIQRGNWPQGLLDSWRDHHGPRPEWDDQEAQIELLVSGHIRAMPLLWLSVTDRADRAYIERNSIALLSRKTGGVDPPSVGWLGRDAVHSEVRESGLWNVNHVNDRYDPQFLRKLDQLISHHPVHSGPS
jgi:hypothetical protein